MTFNKKKIAFPVLAARTIVNGKIAIVAAPKLGTLNTLCDEAQANRPKFHNLNLISNAAEFRMYSHSVEMFLVPTAFMTA